MSNASEFHVMLWNLNYMEETDNEFVKEGFKFTKEFVKASRQIYKLISSDPHITVAQMSDAVNLSSRQVLKYLKQLQEQQK